MVGKMSLKTRKGKPDRNCQAYFSDEMRVFLLFPCYLAIIRGRHTVGLAEDAEEGSEIFAEGTPFEGITIDPQSSIPIPNKIIF
jgi:hypothetical protein